ncbi:MAG: type II toxin-antitoxin system RelE/ParE family toxin [Bdellovibrionota bacterium]
MAIITFADKATEDFFVHAKLNKKVGWSAVVNVARRKLDMIHYAHFLTDLKVPPGNRLEALSGKLKGYHSIRINDQWRIVFKWTQAGAAEVEICDYH